MGVKAGTAHRTAFHPADLELPLDLFQRDDEEQRDPDRAWMPFASEVSLGQRVGTDF